MERERGGAAPGSAAPLLLLSSFFPFLSPYFFPYAGPHSVTWPPSIRREPPPNPGRTTRVSTCLGACIFNVYRRAGRGVGGGGVSGGGGDCRRAHQRETEKPFLSLSPSHSPSARARRSRRASRRSGICSCIGFFCGKREEKKRERREEVRKKSVGSGGVEENKL